MCTDASTANFKVHVMEITSPTLFGWFKTFLLLNAANNWLMFVRHMIFIMPYPQFLRSYELVKINLRVSIQLSCILVLVGVSTCLQIRCKLFSVTPLSSLCTSSLCTTYVNMSRLNQHRHTGLLFSTVSVTIGLIIIFTDLTSGTMAVKYNI